MLILKGTPDPRIFGAYQFFPYDGIYDLLEKREWKIIDNLYDNCSRTWYNMREKYLC